MLQSLSDGVIVVCSNTLLGRFTDSSPSSAVRVGRLSPTLSHETNCCVTWHPVTPLIHLPPRVTGIPEVVVRGLAASSGGESFTSPAGSHRQARRRNRVLGNERGRHSNVAFQGLCDAAACTRTLGAMLKLSVGDPANLGRYRNEEPCDSRRFLFILAHLDRDRGFHGVGDKADHAEVVDERLVEAASVRGRQEFFRACSLGALKAAREAVGDALQSTALGGNCAVALFPGAGPGRNSSRIHVILQFELDQTDATVSVGRGLYACERGRLTANPQRS